MPSVKKIEGIIRPGKLESLLDELEHCGVSGLTVSQVMGHGKQKGYAELYRGKEIRVRLLPKVKVETVVADAQVAQVVETFLRAARTGEVGDGKIFISPVEQVIQIRNGVRDEEAL
ncbi:Nitrogen regulatory protein P-II [Acididesulfobacillus acetoxydans]|uniref:Nitrogen regulatory protein P-II n=1 Tax=Acididesulfobacillus acetoxydans TaxID=1561005 RepID=A0A8S0W7G4_9FIRM|nr:Nitrogen regulatory protein P-II [Acididesulfobacillus acetoxydans]CEJ06162.1 Nitrogen regulatory protein P-II [Acididesulfobacillus acetoxydans]